MKFIITYVVYYNAKILNLLIIIMRLWYKPVFILKTEDGISLEVAGKIIFARNIEHEFSTDIGSIKFDSVCVCI